MIRYQILRLDDGGAGALLWAKKQCARLVEMSVYGFARSWTLDGFSIEARGIPVEKDGFIVKLSVKGGGVDAAYLLGATSPTLYLNRGSLTPNFTGGATAFGSVDIYRAIAGDAKVSRAQAYTWATGYFVTFDPTLFNFLAEEVDDPAVANVYRVAVPAAPRKFDFAAGSIWYSVSSYAGDRGILWLAADLDKVVNGYVATYHLTLVDGKVPDGNQTFHVSMAGDRMAVPVTVTFTDGKISNVDTSSAAKGLWRLMLTSSSLDKDGLLTLTYTQRFNGDNAVLIVDSLAVSVPNNVDTTTATSFFQEPDPNTPGVTADVTVPATHHNNDYTVTEFATGPAVSSDPFLVGFIRHTTYDESLSGILVATGNGGNGHIPYTVALNIAATETLTAVFSDGTTQPVSDPTVPIFETSSGPSFQTPVPLDLDIAGANVPRYSYTFPSTEELDLRHMPFSEKAPALGYEVARFASNVQPNTYERIEIRKLDGTLLRSAYRTMAGAGSNIIELENAGIVGLRNYTTTTTDNTGAWVQSGTYSTLLHLNITAPPFVLYDAMVSVNEHVFTLAKMSKASGIGPDSALAVVPPGWAVASSSYRQVAASTLASNTASVYADIAQALADFADEAAHPTRWLKDDGGNLLPELQDAHDRALAIVTVCEYLETAVADPDVDGANATKYIDKVLDFFSAYADANADQDFAPWAKDLRAEYTDAKAPRKTPLGADEFAHLFTGYLSAHMRIVANPFNVPYTTILCLGAGSWLWGTG